jgi:hypothetical protein
VLDSVADLPRWWRGGGSDVRSEPS